MMDGLIVELLKDKWKTFVGHRLVLHNTGYMPDLYRYEKKKFKAIWPRTNT
jgi:hypothetical protein